MSVEVACSRWIRRTGSYAYSIILLACFVSGLASFYLSITILNFKKEQAVNAPVPPPPVVTPMPPIPKPSPPPRTPYVHFLDPVVSVALGSKISANCACRVDGEPPAENLQCFGGIEMIVLHDHEPMKAEEDRAYSRFFLKLDTTPEPDMVPPLANGEAKWGTFFGPLVNQDLVDSTDQALLVTGLATYHNADGERRREFCHWLQPPLSNPQRVWHFCKAHNELK